MVPTKAKIKPFINTPPWEVFVSASDLTRGTGEDSPQRDVFYGGEIEILMKKWDDKETFRGPFST